MRTFFLVGLVLINAILAVGVASHLLHVPQAKAQTIGLSGNFIMVNGTILGSASDAVYMVDLGSRQLSALLYDRPTQAVTLVGTRDLVRDLGVVQQVGMPRPGAPVPRLRRAPVAPAVPVR